MIKSWSDRAWDDYLWWLNNDKINFKKINNLIKNIDRNDYYGIGEPELLKYGLSGWWSRKITKKDRIIYRIIDNSIEIASCKGHYDDK